MTTLIEKIMNHPDCSICNQDDLFNFLVISLYHDINFSNKAVKLFDLFATELQSTPTYIPHEDGFVLIGMHQNIQTIVYPHNIP